jgi:hypothetical protein
MPCFSSAAGLDIDAPRGGPVEVSCEGVRPIETHELPEAAPNRLACHAALQGARASARMLDIPPMGMYAGRASNTPGRYVAMQSDPTGRRTR